MTPTTPTPRAEPHQPEPVGPFVDESTLPEGVSATFTHRCRKCGGMVHVVAGAEQPHECEPQQPGEREALIRLGAQAAKNLNAHNVAQVVTATVDAALAHLAERRAGDVEECPTCGGPWRHYPWHGPDGRVCRDPWHDGSLTPTRGVSAERFKSAIEARFPGLGEVSDRDVELLAYDIGIEVRS